MMTRKYETMSLKLEAPVLVGSRDVRQSIRVDMGRFLVDMMVKPMGRLGFHDRNADGKIVVGITRRMGRCQVVRRCFRAAH